MKHLKLFEEFGGDTDKIEIISIDGSPSNQFNRKVEKDQYEFSDFDFTVVGEYSGTKKTISVPHDIFIEFIKNSDEKMDAYLNYESIEDLDKVLDVLKGFNWDFAGTINKYINDVYTPSEFEDLEDDELSEWDEQDQDKYDDLLDPDDEDEDDY